MGFLNLFKYNDEVLVENPKLETPKIINNEVNINQQIYNDVYSAQKLLFDEFDLLQKEVENIGIEDFERMSKLAGMGFSNAEQIKEVNVLKNRLDKAEINKNLIREYSEIYPLYRFIDEESVKSVCKKYGLLVANVSDYISDIPKKNQEEILNFKVRKGDIDLSQYIIGRLSHSTWFTYDNMDKFMEGKNLLILAPKEKLNTYGRRIDGIALKIDDPVVLQPVHGGFLIVTSWGLEASDEMIVNSKMN